MEPLLADRPSRRVCTLMARIEAGDTRNSGLVREWLARALRAPRDPAWVADGVISDRWAPLSPVTGQLDAFEWRIPMERVAPADSDALPLEIAELERLERLEQAEPAAVAAHTGGDDDKPKLAQAAPPTATEEGGADGDDTDTSQAERGARSRSPRHSSRATGT